MRGKIVSDGTAMGSHIFTDEGAEIKGITRVSFDLTADHSASTLDLSLCAYGIEVESRARFFMVHPETGASVEVAKIVFADGSEWGAQ